MLNITIETVIVLLMVFRDGVVMACRLTVSDLTLEIEESYEVPIC